MEERTDEVDSHDPAHTMERRCDVLVVGGGPAGLAAALQLARQHRSVIVVDAGEPRNAPAAHMHGYLGRDGTAPADMAAVARSEVRRYGSEVIDGRVSDVVPVAIGEFRAELTGGHTVSARKVVVATGLTDVLPDIEGVARHWGRAVVHCPFCHGYEVRDRAVVVVVTHHMGLHQAKLFTHLTASLTIVIHEEGVADEPELAALKSAGVESLHQRVKRLVDDDTGALVGVELADESFLHADAVVIGPRFRVHTDGLASLALDVAAHPLGLGDAVVTDETGASSVPGVYAAGNVVDASQQVLHAAAHGSRVGAMVALALAEEDLSAHRRPSFNEADWDRRYSGERMWSGNPNGALVAELASMTPGRGLDVGAGEGGDALWMAEKGWEVTAIDVSQRALDGVSAEAGRRGLTVHTRHVDANAPGAFDGVGTFDLVSVFYAAIPRTAEQRALRSIVGAVAPGGTLLVVGHDPEPMREPIDTAAQSRMFDPGAFVGVEDFASVLAADPRWTVEVHEKRPRPAGASSSHHVDDIIFRARFGG